MLIRKSNERRRAARLQATAVLLLGSMLTACGGGGGDSPASDVSASPTPTPAPAPAPGPSPAPAPAPNPAPSNPDLSVCPNFWPGFTSDPGYLQCMAGTYTGTTVSGAACTLTFGGPGKGFSYVAEGIDYSAPDAAFGDSIYGKASSPLVQLEASVSYKILPDISPINYRIGFSFLYGLARTKTITVQRGNQGAASSCRIEL